MTKQRIIISVVVLINLIIGRIFHESLDLVCISELFIVAGTSLLFWNLSLPFIKKASLKLQSYNQHESLLMHSVLGISTSILNVLISQVAIIFAIIYIYQCSYSPSFSFLNASLTNNIALNLSCYAFLAFMFMNDFKHIEKKPNEKNTADDLNVPSAKIVLSSNTQKEIIDVSDIIFIEASNNCIIINTQKGKFVKYQSLKSFLETHHFPNLKRVHRSYAVNLDFISSIEKNKNGDGFLHLRNDVSIKFSRTYKESIYN